MSKCDVVSAGTGPLVIKRRTSSMTSQRLAQALAANAPSADVSMATCADDLDNVDNLPAQDTPEACNVSAIRWVPDKTGASFVKLINKSIN